MTNIVPLSTIKKNSSASIIRLDAKTDSVQRDLTKHLQDLGFIPGHKVKVLQKNFGMVKTQIHGGSQFAIDKNTANLVLVSPLEKDSVEFTKPTKNFLTKMIEFFSGKQEVLIEN